MFLSSSNGREGSVEIIVSACSEITSYLMSVYAYKVLPTITVGICASCNFVLHCMHAPIRRGRLLHVYGTISPNGQVSQHLSCNIVFCCLHALIRRRRLYVAISFKRFHAEKNPIQLRHTVVVIIKVFSIE